MLTSLAQGMVRDSANVPCCGRRAGVREDGSPPEARLEPGTPEWALHEPVSDIDSRDQATPDAWVPRHLDLIRLTGRCAGL